MARAPKSAVATSDDTSIEAIPLGTVPFDRAVAWFENKWTRPECPFHGKTAWGISDFVLSVRAWNPKGAVPVRKSHPLIAVTCQTCGYTVFVNAVTAGIVPPDKPEGEPQESGEES